MKYRLVSRSLGIIALMIGGMMLFSLPWAYPWLGNRSVDATGEFEWHGFWALLASIVVSGIVGGLFFWLGRGSHGRIYRKEALAVVGLSWILATVLGALPYYFGGVKRAPPVRMLAEEQKVLLFDFGYFKLRRDWQLETVTKPQSRILAALLDAGARGLNAEQLCHNSEVPDAPQQLVELAASSPSWNDAILFPDPAGTPHTRAVRYRVRWIRMGLADALFESQSGFSTTGATVISDLEDPQLVPHCILFWRSSTHFLGGLGIIVLLVVVLGHGSAGKAMMRAEMPGPTKEASTVRMQHTAWLFAGTYCGLNLLLAVILNFLGLTVFDATCHAFGTMATGGFSTYNASLGHFDSAVIEYTVVFFMLLAGTNFTLLYLTLTGNPGKLFRDIEWRVYMIIVLCVTTLVIFFGTLHADFVSLADGMRYGLFQVVSIVTTTGFGTTDFDRWNSFGRGVLFLLMFVGGCAGSTGGGMKVIRHLLFVKILRIEVERSYHPSVVRSLRLGNQVIRDVELRKNILVYFGLILIIFVTSWIFLVAVEPDVTWGMDIENKLIDSASGVAATLNNIGPGLGTVGATQNYTNFSPVSKVLFVWLMMIGRLEIYAILVLFSINFWRRIP
jgi:trk system potassium uptake protein TrkH